MGPRGLLATLCLLLLTGCASGGSTTPGNQHLLTVRLTFGAPVNIQKFEYFIVFNLDNDPNQVPRIEPTSFEDRTRIGDGWDVYYQYGTPGGRVPGFYKGQGGLDAAGHPKTDGTGFPFILKVASLANGPEIVDTAVVAGVADPTDPTATPEANNTILWRFDLDRFPSVTGLPNNPVRFRMGVLVSDRSIDDVENPDDGDTADVKMYDRFLEGAVRFDLSQRSQYSEVTDPQENFEEVKPNNTPPLSGPYAAADLKNWSVELVTS